MFQFNKPAYKALLGLMESGNNYSVINSIGAIGKYQFLTSTLDALQNTFSLPDWISPQYFASHPELQEKYIDALITDSLNYIERNDLKKYFNKNVNGTKRFKTITAPLNIYGMLAAVHLAGAPALKNFLLNNVNPDDGFTSLSDYAALFSSKISGFTNYIPLVLAFIPAIVLYYVK